MCIIKFETSEKWIFSRIKRTHNFTVRLIWVFFFSLQSKYQILLKIMLTENDHFNLWKLVMTCDFHYRCFCILEVYCKNKEKGLSLKR